MCVTSRRKRVDPDAESTFLSSLIAADGGRVSVAGHADTMAERFRMQLAEADDRADELRMEKVLSAKEQKLFAAYVNDYSPAWVRLHDMVGRRLQSS